MLLEGTVVVVVDDIKHTQYEHFCGKLPKFLKFLKQWGEAGTVKVRIRSTPKLNNRRFTCMMVGYATKQEANCYEMLDPYTGTVYETCDQKALTAEDEEDLLQPWPEGSNPRKGLPALKQRDINVDNGKNSKNKSDDNKSILDVGEGE
eukprot:15324682-Ditylum_brightwellii.AAC.2